MGPAVFGPGGPRMPRLIGPLAGRNTLPQRSGWGEAAESREFEIQNVRWAFVCAPSSVYKSVNLPGQISRIPGRSREVNALTFGNFWRKGKENVQEEIVVGGHF